MSDNKNILVIQTAFIGDLIMSTSIFPALKEIFPKSTIDVVTIQASSIILKNNPYVNNVFTFDKKNTFKSKINSFFDLVKILKSNKYDIGISIQHSITSSLLMLLSNIKYKVGNQRMKFVDKNIQIPKGLHNKDRVLSLLKAFTDKEFDNSTEIYFNNKIDIKNQLIKNNKKNICVAPGSVWETKKLPTNKYIEIINNLTDYNIYLIGANNEKIICDEILYNVSHENIVNFVGEFNLLESAELIKHSDLLLCNDSAPLHIGNAVNTPVFAFFGPTVKRFGCYPYREKDQMIEVDLDCRPCGKHGSNKCPLGHHRCMNGIKVEDVINKVNNLLG